MFSAQASRRSVEAPFPNPAAQAAGAVNRAFMNNIATGGGLLPSPTAAGDRQIAAVMINVAKSGIFEYGFTVSITGATAADTIDFTVTSYTAVADAMNMVTATSQKVGPGTPYQQGTGSHKANGAFVAVNAGGIQATGTAGALVQATSGTQVLATGGTTTTWSPTGTIQNSITATTETPFTIDHQVALILSVNLSAHALNFDSLSAWIREL